MNDTLQQSSNQAPKHHEYDVIIVGGGPAGLSAALVLGRCRRAVLVIDAGTPRNRSAQALHGYLTRDGITPAALLAAAHEELLQYGVHVHTAIVQQATKEQTRFAVHTATHTYYCKRLVLATGISDNLPQIPGFDALYGTCIHHCQYCDGWEWRDKRIAVFGQDRKAVGQALALKTWSADIVVLTHDTPLRASLKAVCTQHNIPFYTQPIQALHHIDKKLQHIQFADNSTLPCDALFFNTGVRQKSTLAAQLGCAFDMNGGVRVDKRGRSCVQGLFVIGDALREVQFAITAAADGATAAVAINHELQREEGLSV